MDQIKPIFFKPPVEFRKWLHKNHAKATELLVGFYKVGSSKPSMSWLESVDEALCFGWIDGVRKSIDDISYRIRFTPRKPNSTWSNVNINKVNTLTEKGLMQPAGIEAYKKERKKNREFIVLKVKLKYLHHIWKKNLKQIKKPGTFLSTTSILL